MNLWYILINQKEDTLNSNMDFISNSIIFVAIIIILSISLMPLSNIKLHIFDV